MSFAAKYLAETMEIVAALDSADIDAVAVGLAASRQAGGRLFILGVGGSAGHAGHAVNDFRKICGFEAYAPTDNVSELTARINDEGWDTTFAAWLEGSRLRADDARAGVLVWAAATPSGTCRRTSSMRWTSRSSGAPACSASSGATAATPPGRPTRAS